jgi:hypothetical protein
MASRDYPSMTKFAEFTGHTSPRLHLAPSPADQMLHFWKCFGDANVASAQHQHSVSCRVSALGGVVACL